MTIAQQLRERSGDAMSKVAHFSINADDVARARSFYESVFGWKFKQAGPPDFFTIDTGENEEPPIMESIHPRRELKEGLRMNGYECTISVPSLSETVAAIRAQNGNIVMEETTIVGIGRMIVFQDSEGNVVGAMQYDKTAK
jgi:predicted enzyme related to lactoylglutathione lyase